MEENKQKVLKVKDLILSNDPTLEEAIEAIKCSNSYIIAHVHQEHGVGLIKNVHDDSLMDFDMSLLGGTAALGFIAKYLRNIEMDTADKFASQCTILADNLFNLFLRLHDLPTLNHEEDDDESDE